MVRCGEPETIDELKGLITLGSALRQYVKYFQLGRSTQNRAAQFQLQAVRKAGQWLQQFLPA